MVGHGVLLREQSMIHRTPVVAPPTYTQLCSAPAPLTFFPAQLRFPRRELRHVFPTASPYCNMMEASKAQCSTC
jgi:hypothetical protein